MASLTPHVVRVHNLIVFIFLTLSFAFFVNFNNSIVKGDDKLIQLACHDTDSPATCLQCLRSDPEAANADRVEIATILVSCLSNHASNLATNMSDLATRAKDKKMMKSICEACSNGCHGAMRHLNEATNKIKNGEYDDANISLSKALESELDCHSSVYEHKKFEFPENVVYEMNVYEQLSDAALRIIDRL